MQTRRFGPLGEVPIIGQGTWKLRDHTAAAAALARGVDVGMRHIDTAELYTGSEATVARAITGRREDVFLVSKVLPHHATNAGVKEACAESMKRLKTDHLDVYLLHWPGPVPLEETMSAMADLIDEGWIKAAGVSNFDVDGMEAARAALGGHMLACNQVLYHPGQRDVEVDVMPYCTQHDIAVVGYSPFGSGRFPGGSRGKKAVQAIAQEHGKTPHQVILDVLSRKAFQIPKAETVAHVEENARALDRRLPDDAVAAFDEAFPVPETVHGVPSL